MEHVYENPFSGQTAESLSQDVKTKLQKNPKAYLAFLEKNFVRSLKDALKVNDDYLNPGVANAQAALDAKNRATELLNSIDAIETIHKSVEPKPAAKVTQPPEETETDDEDQEEGSEEDDQEEGDEDQA
jgi:hypothetical protein